MSKIRIGLIGAGSMGALHARVISSHPDTSLVWVHDQNRTLGMSIAERFKSRFVSQPDPEVVDAIVVATPTQTHFDIAKSLLELGKPLLVEKPLAQTFAQVSSLVEVARNQGVVLQCGLLERFNPVVRTVADLTLNPLQIRTARHSPPASRITTGVIGDLLIHDVDLILRLMACEPVKVAAFSDRMAWPAQVEETVESLLRFEGERLATASATRQSHQKVRSMSIVEADRLIEVDLLRRDITIYKHVLEAPVEAPSGYRQQTIIEIPVVQHQGEPLMLQLSHFVALIREEADRISELDSILLPHDVVARIEQATFNS